jgi:hypothetical protein
MDSGHPLLPTLYELCGQDGQHDAVDILPTNLLGDREYGVRAVIATHLQTASLSYNTRSRLQGGAGGQDEGFSRHGTWQFAQCVGCSFGRVGVGDKCCAMQSTLHPLTPHTGGAGSALAVDPADLSPNTFLRASATAQS